MKFTLALSVFSLFSLFNVNSFTSGKRNLMNSTETDFETSSINRNYEQSEETKFQTINFLFFDSHSENVDVPIGQSVLDYLPDNTQTVNDGFYSHIYTWLQIDTFSFKEDEKVVSVSTDYTFVFFGGESSLIKVPQNGSLNDYIPDNTASSFSETVETYYLWDFDNSDKVFKEKQFERQFANEYLFTYINGETSKAYLPFGGNISDFLPLNSDCFNDGYTQTDYIWVPSSRYSFKEVGTNITVSTTYTFTFKNGTKQTVVVPQNGNVEDYYPSNTATTNDGYTETSYSWIQSDGLNYIEKVTYTTVSTTYSFTFIDGHTQQITVPQNGNVEDYYPTNTSDLVQDCVRHTYSWQNASELEFIEVDTPIDIMLINYVLNGGTNDSNNLFEIHSGQSFTLCDATKYGYHFDGWFKESTFDTQITSISFSKSEITIYAKFTIIHYNITYHLDGGTNAIKNPSTYTVDDSLVLKPATKPGYHFDGWFTDSNFTNEIKTLGGTAEDLELYALFSPEQYQATFNLEKGTWSTSTNITLNYQIPGQESVVKTAKYLPYSETVPTYNGHVFAGWYLNRELTDELSDNLVITGNVSLYAKWQETEYVAFAKGVTGKQSTQYIIPYGLTKVTFRFTTSSYSGRKCYIVNETTETTTTVTSTTSSSYTYVTAAVSPFDIIRVYSSSNSSNSATGITYNQVSIDKYTVSQTSDFRNSINAYYEYGEGGALPTPYSTPSGYKFIAWKDSENNLYNYYSQLPIGGISLEPYYEPISYTINYVLNGGTNNPNNVNTYSIEEEAVLYSPTRDGYDFLGWSLYSYNTNYVTKINWQTRGGGNVSVYANWQIHDYSVELNLNGGKIVSDFYYLSDEFGTRRIVADEGQIIEYYLPSGNLKPGYLFGGWRNISNGELFEFSGTLPCDISNLLNDSNQAVDSWIEYDSAATPTHLGNSHDIIIQNTDIQYFAFVPLNTQTITIRTNGSFDTYGTLCDSSFNTILENDDTSDSDLNFEINATVEGGALYYIGIRGTQNTSPVNGTLEISGNYIPTSSLYGSTTNQNAMTVHHLDSFVLPLPVKEGFTFVGWKDQNDNMYSAGQNYSFTCLTNLQLTAVWVAE